MTSRKDLCTQFVKYNLYPCINIFKGSCSTPWGVSEQHHLNCLSALHKEGCLSQAELGDTDMDDWVLQTVQGYLIDFTHNPYQSRQPQPIVLPLDKHVLVAQEVQDLLQK